MADEKNPKNPPKNPDELGPEPQLHKRGWPSVSENPFVDPGYYQRFDPRVRPEFVPGSGTSSVMTVQQYEHQRTRGEIWKIVTAFNFSMRTLIITIPGGQPGSAIQVKLPPLGVIRSAEEALPLFQSPEGSKFEFMRLASPYGDCGRARKIKSDGIDHESCDFVGCPHHPVPDPEKPGQIFGHAVIEAQRLLSSIGAPLTEKYTDKDGKQQERVSFTPPVEHSLRECMLVTKIDARGPVGHGVHHRMTFLQDRERKFQDIARKGGQAAGR